MNKNVMSSPKVCAMCGKEYTPTSNRQKYCIDCKRELNKQKCTAYYKKTYKPKGYDQSGEKNNAYKTGIGAYKEKALKHFGSKCMKCGSTKYICVHHRDENRKNNKLDNLEVLCRSCHAKAHALYKNFNV